MLKILVIGASSGIGLQTVKHGLDAGHEIRAFSRTADKINLIHSRLEKLSGNALEERDIANAIAGVDVVIQTLGVPFNFKLITGPIELFSRSTEILIRAMNTFGVHRIIAVTGFGAGTSKSSINIFQRPAFNAIFGRAYRDKDVQEEKIKASQLKWTIVRPGVLTNQKISTDCKVLLEPDEWKNGIISRNQIAHYLIKQAESNEHIMKTPVLIG